MRLQGVAAAAAAQQAVTAAAPLVTGLASARCVQHMLVKRTQSRMPALPVALMGRVGSPWGGAAPWPAHLQFEGLRRRHVPVSVSCRVGGVGAMVESALHVFAKACGHWIMMMSCRLQLKVGLLLCMPVGMTALWACSSER